MDPDGRFIINNALLENKTKSFAIKEGKNSHYLNGNYTPTIFSFPSDKRPGFPIFSFFEKNIGFTQSLEDALNFANILRNDNNPTTNSKIYAEAKIKENGIYEIKITISTNLSNKTTSGIVAYAGEEEIILNGKIDQTKINEIANYSINTVMEWDNDTQNIDNN